MFCPDAFYVGDGILSSNVRILILAASVGAGHVRAAEAVELAIRQADPTVTIANIDVLNLMPPAFRKVYRDGYFRMIARAPKLLGWLYAVTDKPFSRARIQTKLERAVATRLLKKVREFEPTVVICTHFLPTALLHRERTKGRYSARTLTVVT
ncbi:MAG TPA: hypothetical protein VG897_12555, partial [Terriglobales bacterium]|nr:hypothetical protein [Terriglobales bacterium]